MNKILLSSITALGLLFSVQISAQSYWAMNAITAISSHKNQKQRKSNAKAPKGATEDDCGNCAALLGSNMPNSEMTVVVIVPFKCACG